MTEKIKLLVVDDEIQFLGPLVRRLRLRGFDVTEASRGQDAIELVEETRFDLAVLDLKMPEVDGKQILAALKKQDDFIEVIIMTGHGSAEAASECMQIGAFSYLPKPHELETILEALRRAYAKRLKREHESSPELLEKLGELEKKPDPVAALQEMRELVEGRMNEQSISNSR